MSSIICEVLFPSSPSILCSNVMICITVLPQVSKHHTHLQDRGELVQHSEEQRIDLGSPKPLVGALCPGSTSLWLCVGYTELGPATEVTSSAPKTCQRDF